MFLLILMATLAATQTGAIEATIRGTAQPLEVELLRRTASEEWEKVDVETLPANKRRVRFDNLESGVYQLLVRGPRATERLATKMVVGTGDTRQTTITIEPFVLSGRVTLGGTELGGGVIMLRHREFHWRSAIGIAADGTFAAPLWQRGPFTYNIESPALPTDYAHSAEIEGASPVRLTIDIPDGRSPESCAMRRAARRSRMRSSRCRPPPPSAKST
jgi:hypothetical protein